MAREREVKVSLKTPSWTKVLLSWVLVLSGVAIVWWAHATRYSVVLPLPPWEKLCWDFRNYGIPAILALCSLLALAVSIGPLIRGPWPQRLVVALPCAAAGWALCSILLCCLEELVEWLRGSWWEWLA